jgi:hypothetical protein
METTSSGAGDAARTAAADLADIERVQRVVRNRPWPIWLYVANSALLGAMALTPLAGPLATPAWLVTCVSIFLVNLFAGWKVGVLFAVPTSRGFLALVCASTACLVTALIGAFVGMPDEAVLAAAATTTASFGAAAVVHWRSTRR